MRLGYFGGSFDPPHRGHLAIASAAQSVFGLEKVLIAPTASQPLKPNGPMASFEDRAAMVRLLCDDAPGIELSLIEAPREDGAPNYTIDTLTRLRATLQADDTIFSIVGADSFLDLRRWKDPAGLLAAAEWIVVSRPAFLLERFDELALTPEERVRVHLLPDMKEPASSTEIRHRLGVGAECADLIPQNVLSYIKERHLYGSS